MKNRFLNFFLCIRLVPGLLSVQSGPGKGNLTCTQAEQYKAICQIIKTSPI